MCILLKLNYAKCSVSNLFFSKVIEERPLGARHSVQEGLTAMTLCTPMGLSTPTSNTETDSPKGLLLIGRYSRNLMYTHGSRYRHLKSVCVQLDVER